MPFATEVPLPRVAALLSALLVAGCANWPPPPAVPATPPPPPPPAAQPVLAPPPPQAPAVTAADLATRQVLAYSERLRQMTGTDLARELARLGDPPANPEATVDLALVLGQTHNPGDTARALGLLDALQRAGTPDAAPWLPIARLIAARLAEQRRLEETVERQSQQARESQRRLDQLNEKLEALKAIERSLTTRPGGVAAPASAASKGTTQ